MTDNINSENGTGDISQSGIGSGPYLGGIVQPDPVYSDSPKVDSQISNDNYMPDYMSEKEGTPLPDQISQSNKLNGFKTVEDLASAYLDSTTPPEDYLWEPPPGLNIDPIQNKAFKDLSYRIGLSQEQYNEIQNHALGIYNSQNMGNNNQPQPGTDPNYLPPAPTPAYQQQQAAYQQQQATDDSSAYRAHQALQAAWGSNTEKNVALAQAGTAHVFGADGINKAEEMGLGNDPDFIQRMAVIGQKANEEHYLHGRAQETVSKQTIKKEIDQLMHGGVQSAYHNPQHPDHSNAVNHVRGLFEQLY
jgi:hypothetical protein